MMSQENILHGPPEIKLKDPQQSLGEYFFEKLTFHGNKTSQVNPVTEQSYTFSNVLSLSLKLAETIRYGNGTRKWHVGSGDCIGICSENTIDFCIPVLAAFYLGAAAAPLNPTYTKRELEHGLHISKPKVVFTSKARFNDMVDVSKTTNFVQSVIIIDEIGNDSFSSQSEKMTTDGSYVISINSLLFPEETFIPSLPLVKDFPKVDIAEQVALVMCSSGTTGLAKGVMLTQKNIITCMVQESGTFLFNSKDVILGLLPFFHGYGLVVLLYALSVGMKVVIMPRFDGDFFLKSIEKYKVSTLITVPPLAVFLAKDPRVAKYDLSSISQIICGAAPLGRDIQPQVESVVTKARAKIGAPPCHLRQAYGLTETTLAVTVIPPVSKKYGSIGTLAPGVQSKVVDLETGKALGPNKEGELCFRGATMMKGYLGNPEATAATIDKDGWLLTGDIGYYDEDGYFYIVDRLKELIKYKGFQVPPAELEALLLTHPGVEDAAVIGIPDEAAGELPMAIVVKQPGKDLTEAEVVKFVADRVSPPKRLNGGVRFVKSIPKTASGKILRRELRESYKLKL